MAADDTRPAETPGGADNAGPEQTPGLSAWLKRRTRLEKGLIGAGVVIAAVFAWHFLASGDSAHRDADISNDVKSSMQQQFATDPRFSQYDLVVESVGVVKQTGNQYQGMATVRGPKGIDHEVPIQVTADGDNIIWQSDPGAFAWVALEQLNPATDSP